MSEFFPEPYSASLKDKAKCKEYRIEVAVGSAIATIEGSRERLAYYESNLELFTWACRVKDVDPKSALFRDFNGAYKSCDDLLAEYCEQ